MDEPTGAFASIKQWHKRRVAMGRDRDLMVGPYLFIEKNKKRVKISKGGRGKDPEFSGRREHDGKKKKWTDQEEDEDRTCRGVPFIWGVKRVWWGEGKKGRLKEP